MLHGPLGCHTAEGFVSNYCNSQEDSGDEDHQFDQRKDRKRYGPNKMPGSQNLQPSASSWNDGYSKPVILTNAYHAMLSFLTSVATAQR